MLYHTPLLIFLLSFDVYSSPVNTPYPGTDNTHPVLSHSIKVSNEVYFGNGQLAQKLNSDDKALKAESACGNAQSACIDGALGICLASKFELSSCPESKRCYQIPLLDQTGAEPTCTTKEDAEAKIAKTGAQGGLFGDSTSSNQVSAQIFLKNGFLAQSLNNADSSITADTSCVAGGSACIDGALALCDSNAKYLVTVCPDSTSCYHLPLRGKYGAQPACVTRTDAYSRIAESGATGGVRGSAA